MLYRAARSSLKPDYPSHWEQLPLGVEIKWLTEQLIATECQTFWGYHMVKLGDLSSQLSLNECRVRNQICQTRTPQPQSSLVGLSDELPFQQNSIDSFILTHELDFSQDPHAVLREVSRCIRADGHLVITGFNPYSLAKLASLIPLKTESMLHQARFFSAGRIKDWLQLLGFEVITEKRMLVSELLFERKPEFSSRRYQWCDRYLNRLGSVYLLVAEKRELPLSPIKLRWQARPKFTTMGASVG